MVLHKSNLGGTARTTRSQPFARHEGFLLRRWRALVATASVSRGAPSLFSVPLFPSNRVLHPTEQGSLVAFEPRYVKLFGDTLERVRSTGSRAALRFGHVLSPGAAPPAFLRDGVGGLPPFGVMAIIRDIQRQSDGTYVIDYEGDRRFKILTVDTESEPYVVAQAMWYDDEEYDSLAPTAQQLTDQLEADVLALLREVAQLTARLEEEEDNDGAAASAAAGSSGGGGGGDWRGRRGGGSGELPEHILRHAPPSSLKQQSMADYLIASGSAAGHQMAMWQRQKGVYDRGSYSRGGAKPTDPYAMVREELGRDQRQEMFSFAAASCIDMGVAERLALLESRDTAARLQWLHAAIVPYAQQLAAKSAVRSALRGARPPPPPSPPSPPLPPTS